MPDITLFDQFAQNPSMFGRSGEPQMQMGPIGELLSAFLGNSPQGQMLAMLGQPLLQPMLQPYMTELGWIQSQFFPRQNLYDQLRAQQYWTGRQAAVAAGAAADQRTMEEMIAGGLRIAGREITPDVQASISAFASNIATVTPFLSQVAPDLVDRLHGSRGSAAVMAQALHRGGRFAIDPVSGALGLSGDSAGALSREIYDQLFIDSPLNMRGMSAGQTGMLYEWLQSRGLMGSSIGVESLDIMRQKLGADQQLAAEAMSSLTSERFEALLADYERRSDAAPGLRGRTKREQEDVLAGDESTVRKALDDIERFNPGQFNDLLRNFDARRVGDRLSNLAGVISGMRDIFGDAGRPNAPMAQLLQGLQQLTQGGLATQRPADLEMLVRRMQMAASQSGVGLEALQGLTGQAGALADQLGLERVFAPEATLGATTFAMAMSDVGRLDIPVFGRRSREHLLMADQQMRLRAANSELANLLGAVRRAGRTTAFTAGSEAEAVAQAINAGQSSYEFGGSTRSLDISESEALRILETGGMDRSTGAAFIQARFANQEDIHAARIDQTVRDQFQTRALARQALGQAFGVSAAPAVSRAASAMGLSETQATSLAMSAGVAAGEALRTADPAVMLDAKQRNRLVAATLRERFVAQMVENGMARPAAEAVVASQFSEDQLLQMAEAGYGRLSEDIRTNPNLRGFESAPMLLDLINEKNNEQRRVRERRVRVDAEIASNMAGLGRTGPLARLMDELRDPSTTAMDALNRVLGSVREGDIAAALTPIQDAIHELESLGPEDRRAQRQILALQKGGVASRQMLEQMADDRGVSVAELFTTGAARDQTVARALQAAAKLGGELGLTARPRVTLQLAGLRELQARMKLAEADKDAAKRDEARLAVSRQMAAVMAGGDAARGAAAAFLGERDVADLSAEDAAIYQALRASEAEGASATFERLGIPFGAAVSGERIQDVLRMGQDLPEAMKEASAEDRAKAYTAMSGEEDRIVASLRTDRLSKAQLGRLLDRTRGTTSGRDMEAGELVTALEKAKAERLRIAKAQGFDTVGAALAAGNTEVLAADAAFRELLSEAGLRMGAKPVEREQLPGMIVDPTEAAALTEAYTLEQVLGQLQELSGGTLARDELGRVQEALKSGGGRVQQAVGQAVVARRELDRLAAEQGYSTSRDLRAAVKAGRISGELADRVGDLEAQASPFLEIGPQKEGFRGRSGLVFEEAVRGVAAGMPDETSGAPPQKITISGNIRLLDNRGNAEVEFTSGSDGTMMG